MPFESEEGAEGEADVVALGAGEAGRASFHFGGRLEAAVGLLDLPGPFGVGVSVEVGHREVVRDPMFRVAIRGPDPKRFHESEPFEVNDRARRGDHAIGDRAVARFVRVDPAVGRDLREEVPAVATHSFEVLLRGIPGIEANVTSTGPAPLR